MAGHGIRTRDSSGRVIFDLSTSMTKILGKRSTTTSNGSFSHPAFSLGTPFYILYIDGSKTRENQYPRLYVSGNRIYWEFPSGNRNTPIAISFLYGVYI